MLKKGIACTLAALLLLGMLGGCSAAEQTPSTEPKETQSEEEKNVLKILTLGSSSTVDACHMLNLVAAAEGVEQELVVGTLYYSGCTLTQHIQFLTQNSNVYSLYVSREMKLLQLPDRYSTLPRQGISVKKDLPLLVH